MIRLFGAAAILAMAATVAAPALAHPRHHRDVYHEPLISYLHNYGPGLAPGTFAYYDGPATNRCYQSSAAYIGQDRRRHPCF